MSDILGQIGALVGQEFNRVSDRFQDLAGSDNYSEITYDSSGNVSSISTWVDNSKTTLIKVKTLTYTSGSLAGIVVTDGSNTKLTQTLAYNSSGNLESIEKDYA
jgi:ribosomal protein S4E